LGYINGIPTFRARELKSYIYSNAAPSADVPARKLAAKLEVLGKNPTQQQNYPSIWQTVDRRTEERVKSLV